MITMDYLFFCGKEHRYNSITSETNSSGDVYANNFNANKTVPYKKALVMPCKG